MRIWPGWRSHTWICWAAPRGRSSTAVNAVREVVTQAWQDR
jgi:hypothetical protein